jgi:hypothetical protein
LRLLFVAGNFGGHRVGAGALLAAQLVHFVCCVCGDVPGAENAATRELENLGKVVRSSL